MLMEEAQPANAYIQERGQAIEAIEKTINELGSIFGQLAGMVQEQGEMLQRIDANTEDVVDNVQGAQRELLKYWSRVQGNRWLVAKMFGVLMVSLCLTVPESNLIRTDLLSAMGAYFRLSVRRWGICEVHGRYQHRHQLRHTEPGAEPQRRAPVVRPVARVHVHQARCNPRPL